MRSSPIRFLALSVLCGLSLLLRPSVGSLTIHAVLPPRAEALRPDPEVPEWFYESVRTLQRDPAATQGLWRTMPPEHQATARFVEGLFAYARSDFADAQKLLGRGTASGLGLSDWRLFLLAESAEELGELDLARISLARLLSEHPSSPLGTQAMVRAGQLAWRQKDAADALAIVQRARDLAVPDHAGFELERLAWEVGSRIGDRKAVEASTRRLLTEYPAAAEGLGLTRSGGWRRLLTVDELYSRANALERAGQHRQAFETLEAVPPTGRSFEWYLLEARVLTRRHQAATALELLEEANPVAPDQPSRLAWARAEALLELARVHPGRSNAHPDERESSRRLARNQLLVAARLAGSSELAVKAWRSLYRELVGAELFEPSLDALRRLKALEPGDTTGARDLWGRGWGEYSHRDYSEAIGIWSELSSLYPRTPEARSGRYWSARAFESLGAASRAEEIYRKVLSADTEDFYSRNAARRLGLERGSAGLPEPPPPWPTDPRLERARRLFDLGLDELAWEEVELQRGACDERPVAALQALILTQQDKRRASMQYLRRAFPALASAHQDSVPRQAMELYYLMAHRDSVERWARRRRIPVPLLLAVIRQESAFDSAATSRAGARGLMQLMPATARELARRMRIPYSRGALHDPDYSLQVGSAYLAQVLAMFDGSLELALAGYNAGPTRVRRWWRRAGPGVEVDELVEGLRLEEPRSYVKRILLLADSYRRLYPELAV